MADVSEMKKNLQQYKTQLEQVNGLLALDMKNAEYQKLAEELQQAITLTEEAIKVQLQAAAPAGGELLLRKGETVTVFKAGDRCLAPYGEHMYPALVMGEDDNEQVTIRYYGYPDVETKAKSELKPLPPPSIDPTAVTVGTECQAVWVGDQQWYDVVVEAIVEGGYKVRFVQYKVEAEVPLEYLRSREAAQAQSRKRPAAEEKPQGPKEFVIPENLRILPTDTEEEKARKRKKVKYLKHAVKKKEAAEEEATSKSWQSFLNKSKKPKGLKALRKESIFASPDSVDGKVGVTGSGSGMTTFGGRQKWK